MADSQQVGVLGQLLVKVALIKADLEVASPERDDGVDLVAYTWSDALGANVVLPLQVKTASGRAYGIWKKYEAVPGVVMVQVMNVASAAPEVYALTYEESVQVGHAMGWTKTPSWKDKGGYTTSAPSQKLLKMLEPYRMAPGDWHRFFPTAAKVS